MAFGTDSVLLYDVDPWNQLGFGAPNFGADNVATLNRPMWGLTDEIGKIQLYIMTHEDAARHQPPSRNTCERLGKLCNRAKAVLASRQKQYNELRLEAGHASPARLVWNIHPCPYFSSMVLKNKWLREYNDLLMIMLTNAFQHTDASVPLTITSDLAADLYQYIREIKLRFGNELLEIPMDVLKDDSFIFVKEHYDAYSPENVVTRIESLDRPTSVMHLPTEDDLHPLLVGVPANLIIPNLKQYPIGPIPDASGLAGGPIPGYEAASGTQDGSAIGPPTV